MKWINHIAIAGATTAVVSPPLVPLAILGSTAPDWLEWVHNMIFKDKLKHRAETHYVTVWLGAMLFGIFLWDFGGIITAFSYGGLTHVLADSLTIAGVPFAPSSDRRFHLAGGRLRTGGGGEYAFSGVVIVLCFMFSSMTTSTSWAPFFFDWPGLYQEGVVDGKEWKDNRFKFF